MIHDAIEASDPIDNERFVDMQKAKTCPRRCCDSKRERQRVLGSDRSIQRNQYGAEHKVPPFDDVALKCKANLVPRAMAL